jgi:hypothetical protein
MNELPFGRFEFLQIEKGELVLDPWPATVRGVRFSPTTPTPSRGPSGEFELKRQVIEFFEYVRAVESGEIRTLEIKHGLPFSMEIEHQPKRAEGTKRG